MVDKPSENEPRTIFRKHLPGGDGNLTLRLVYTGAVYELQYVCQDGSFPEAIPAAVAFYILATYVIKLQEKDQK